MLKFKIQNKATLPLGFKAAGVACGLKKSGKLDLALFFSEVPSKASCLFTVNKIKAAPVVLSRFLLKKNKLFQAIIANAGNANCFTGRQGLADALQMSKAAANKLGLSKEAVLVASTGVIAKRLDIGKINSAVPLLVKKLSPRGFKPAAQAILTTDTFVKLAQAKLTLGGKSVTILGCAKGAGMISPSMATMLCFVLTDAAITQGALNQALRAATDKSFNSITVDGCMSTNDSVMLLANGLAGNRLIKEGKDLAAFSAGLSRVCRELAKMVVWDAEGASKFIAITVKGAKSDLEAKKAALFIANSNLFKTAVYGQNPNFGRIAAAVGASGIEVREEQLKFRVSDLKKKEVSVKVSVGSNQGKATVYTSDLTPEYIKINAEYN